MVCDTTQREISEYTQRKDFERGSDTKSHECGMERHVLLNIKSDIKRIKEEEEEENVPFVVDHVASCLWPEGAPSGKRVANANWRHTEKENI